MASTINEIIKESIETIRSEGLNLTPDNYSKIFCNVAKKRGVIIEDCQKIDKYSKKLDEKNRADINKFKVSTVDEFISYLVAKVNRANENDATKIINALVLLSKRVLQAVTLLHDKNATDLANSTLARLDFSQNLKSLEMMKDKWFDFITNYDDSFLNELDSYGKVNKEDLSLMVKDIVKLLKKENENSVYESIAPLIIASLTPSIASSMNDDLASISYELRKSPESLATSVIQQEIKKFITKRIELDKDEVKNKISLLDKLLDDINKKIFDLIDKSDVSNEQVKIIKKDLQSISFTKDSFESIHLKLVTIATSLETETKSLSSKMKEKHETIKKLHTRVKSLENALLLAKKESKEDFLTHVATKRALEGELKRAEESYKRYKTDYSLCFVDIDHFKMVNDTYGHEAGDIILSSVGKILKRYIRQVDFVGRYGGEEFLIILPNSDIKQAFHFANKVRSIIDSYKFMYKKERIAIGVSCGLAQRSRQKSMKETVEEADKMLYRAKEAGRNRVMPDFS